MRFGEIIHFATVNREVVELPGGIIEGDEFPSSITDGAVPLMFKEQGALLSAEIDLVDQIGTRQRQLALVSRVRDGDGCWQKIDDVSGSVDDGTRLDFQTRGPVHDPWRSDTAFVIEVLVKSPGCVGGICPARSNAMKSAWAAHLIELVSGVQNVLVAGNNVESEGIDSRPARVPERWSALRLTQRRDSLVAPGRSSSCVPGRLGAGIGLLADLLAKGSIDRCCKTASDAHRRQPASRAPAS